VVVKKTSPEERSFGSKSKEIMVISMISRKDLLDQDCRRRIFWSCAWESAWRSSRLIEMA